MRRPALSLCLPRRLRWFLADCRGSLSVEAALMLPVLVGAFLMTVVFFDVFRTENTNAKASYAVADALSRRVTPVTTDYLEGMHDLYDMLSGSRHPTRMRVSSVDIDDETGAYRVQWSYGTRSTPVLTDAVLNDMIDRLPVLGVGETLLLVETAMDYAPPINAGIPARSLGHLIPTRPRFAPRVLMAGMIS